MYKIVKLKDTVRVPPERFEEPTEDVVLDILRKDYEGLTDKDLGVILSITEVEDIRVGKVIMGDGASHHEAIFKALVYKPELHEVILGEVVEIVDFGAFVRLGPMDGLAHVSQVTDDYISYDREKGVLIGKETNRRLKEGDRLRARIVSVSVRRGDRGKIGLTMRQPGLGKLKWIKEDRKEESGE
ncbi:DNA-directed RNA polymerase subunit E' [candidate division MSBL1 archaeon SCGC-AAA261G05]|uniref:DNA-directed RNA polymerase subunit Rpo7 n=2 Tax=candidate division MSBL1 TaxID=215777 RepID=A0A133V265_9EURY|nr:DNA-directed RNA polymerase subunit E' [candidate division MSBL1 archaeon SCGC-AAA261C02]KXB04020.1 DNA-directed RNA polymerase subunit E' [candidate division MSBL1 archaeon SCGC-AAA261G05]